MPDITKHHSKQKGESDSRKNWWVYLLVSRDAIGIDDFLWGTSVVIKYKWSWVFLMMWIYGDDISGWESLIGFWKAQDLLDFLHVLFADKYLSLEEVGVNVHLIQALVYLLFLNQVKL